MLIADELRVHADPLLIAERAIEYCAARWANTHTTSRLTTRPALDDAFARLNEACGYGPPPHPYLSQSGDTE